jgi:hypothetical protein
MKPHRLFLPLVIGAVMPAVGLAQGLGLGAGAAVELTHVRSQTSSGREALSGALIVGGLDLERGRWTLALRYGQGRVTGDSGALLARDVTTGELRLRFAGRPWLGLGTALRARSYDALGVQRWVSWDFRARLHGDILPAPRRLEGYAEGWMTLAGSTGAPEAWSGGQGGEAGMRLLLDRPRLTGVLAYRVEQARAADSRRETVEGVVIGLSFRVR